MKEIFHRASVRKYLDAPVEEEKIEKMLRAAMAAPSAQNQQPWEFYVVRDPAVREELSHASDYAMCAAHAPVVFVVCMRRECIRPQYAPIDCSAAVENMLLEADGLGLGAVWLGVYPHEDRMEKVNAAIGIDDGLQSFALVACGYPAKEKPRTDRFDPARIHTVG